MPADFQTPFTKLFGMYYTQDRPRSTTHRALLEIQIPLLVPPMAGVSGGALAAAASNEGGFGYIAAGSSLIFIIPLTCSYTPPIRLLHPRIPLARTGPCKGVAPATGPDNQIAHWHRLFWLGTR